MKEAFKSLARRASVQSEEVFEPISDEISVLYQSVRKSHALFQLGLDEEGQDVVPERTYFKCIPQFTDNNNKCRLISKCKPFRDAHLFTGSP